MTRQLWAPWRLEYVKDASKDNESECIFCAGLDAGDDDANLIVRRGERHCEVLAVLEAGTAAAIEDPLQRRVDPGEERAGAHDWNGAIRDYDMALRLKPGTPPRLNLGYEFAEAEVRIVRTLPPVLGARGGWNSQAGARRLQRGAREVSEIFRPAGPPRRSPRSWATANSVRVCRRWAICSSSATAPRPTFPD